MADYIDRQAAIAEFSCCELTPDGGIDAKYVIDFLEYMPTADAIEVVRCGECKYMTEEGRCLQFADDCLRPSVSDYCSYGEVKKYAGVF